MTKTGLMRITIALLPLLGCLAAAGVCVSPAAASPDDDTMLMFVGQELSVVTTASRRPESPSSAPAVVDVVTHKTIARRGYRTLGELLSFESGFYIAPRASGSMPYLRGVPGGVLFLYNGIPMPSGGTQSVYPLDRELSLDNVKQVEIIRGPGSVLWGSDAFAGIVNIVSMGPGDRKTPAIKVFGGSNDYRGAYASGVVEQGPVSTFLSVTKSGSQYHDADYNVYAMDADGAIQASGRKLDDSDFLEITAKGKLASWLTFTGRFSDFTRKYAVENETNLKWDGSKETPVNHVGLSANTTRGRSHFVFSAYYQNQSITRKDMNTAYEETLDQYFGELLWDRSFQHKGVLTLGASVRESRVSGALAGAGFNPGAVLMPFPVFEQKIDQSSYDSRVKSLFGQYRHQLGSASFWAGVRLEEHSDFSSHMPWNFGATWDATDQWRFKTVVGRAYRTPYSQQIIRGISEDTSEIDTVSLQASWKPAHSLEIDLTAFYSTVSGAVVQDPYAGVSAPADNDVRGVELAARAVVGDTSLFANLSGFRYSGEDYRFRVEDFTLVNPEGTVSVFYENWENQFNPGPDILFKAGAFHRISDRAGLSLTGTYTASIPYAHAKNTVNGHYGDYWLFNTAFSMKNLFCDNTTLRFGVKNLFDTSYTAAGFYGPVPGRGRTFFVEWGMAW